jgi:hypothetical protein
MSEKKGSRIEHLIENFIPLPPDDPTLKNYHPTKPGKPQGDPARPFPVDGPIGTKPETGTSPTANPGAGEPKPATGDPSKPTK